MNKYQKDLFERLKCLEYRSLKRALNSTKEYLFFYYNITNAGAICFIKCTNIYKNIGGMYWNGYDFVALNDEEIKVILKEVLIVFSFQEIAVAVAKHS